MFDVYIYVYVCVSCGFYLDEYNTTTTTSNNQNELKTDDDAKKEEKKKKKKESRGKRIVWLSMYVDQDSNESSGSRVRLKWRKR